MDLNSNSNSKQILEERLVVLEIAFDRLDQRFHQREKWCEILNLWILQQFDFNIETYWLDLIEETGVGDGGDPESDDVTKVGVGAGAHGQMFEIQNLGFYTEMPISMEYDDSRELEKETEMEAEADSTNDNDNFEMPQQNGPDNNENKCKQKVIYQNYAGERNACARSAASCATGDVTLEHLLYTPPKQGPSFVPLAIALTSSPAVSAAPKSIQSARPSPQVQAELHQQKEQSHPKQSGQEGAGQIRVGSTSPPNSSSISKENYFPCSRCQKKFCSLDAVEAHMKTHRAKQREKIGHCEHCGKVYRTWKFFQKHCVTCVMDTNSKNSSTSDPNNDHWGFISKDLSDSVANNSSNNSDSIHSTNTAASDSSTTKYKPKQSTSSASTSTTAVTGHGPGTSSGTVKKKPAKPRPSRSKAAKRERALLISNMWANISKSTTTTASHISMSAATGTVSSVMETEAATTLSSLGKGAVTGGSKGKKPNSKEINSVQDIATLPTFYEPNADDLVHSSFFRNVLAAGVEVQRKPTKSPPELKVHARKKSSGGVSLGPYDFIPSPAARQNSDLNSPSNLQSKYHRRSPSEKRPEKSDEEAVLVFNCKVCRLPFPTLEQCRQHIITTHLAQVLQTTPVFLESTVKAGEKMPNSLSGSASPSTSRTSSTTTTTNTTT